MKRPLLVAPVLLLTISVTRGQSDPQPLPTEGPAAVLAPAEPDRTGFKERDIVCAKTNVTSGLTTAFSLPVDFHRGSCWRYEGRSGTGKVKLMITDEAISKLALNTTHIDWFK